jgi:ubiquinone/menaquinone biosynthesis C-methylase UbiE
MSDIPTTRQDLDRALEALYGDIGVSDAEFDARLDRSLQPRGPDMLYDKMGALGLSQDHQLLDIGCRDAAHTCQLARWFGCQALGIDPVAYNIVKANTLITEHGQTGQVRVVEGRIEAIPADAGAFDFIWCRDVLNHVPDLRAGLVECARVLRPAGRMLIYQTFATELLEAHEAARLYRSLAIVPANMGTPEFEAACADSGLRIVERQVIGSEWREYWEETGARVTAGQLLRIARMHRDREQLIVDLGRDAYDCELANCHWGVYQMLGKLCPMLYILGKA